jgi:hypothetical protein
VAGFTSLLELVLGLAGYHVLRGEEPREMLTDNLICPISEKPFSPEVPAKYFPRWISKEQSVIGRPGSKEIEALRQSAKRRNDRIMKVQVRSSKQIGCEVPSGDFALGWIEVSGPDMQRGAKRRSSGQLIIISGIGG